MTPRSRSGLVLVLAVTSGATDAFGFLALGGSFTSVMTGNLVLLGVSFAQVDLALILHTLSAIAGFVAGAAIGSHVAGSPQPDDPIWPPAVTRAMLIELGLFAAYACIWWFTGEPTSSLFITPMLVMNAMALGLQSSAIQRFGVAGLSTTYLTGTLTSVVTRLVHGHGLRTVAHSLGLLGALVAGAGIGAVAVDHSPVLMPIVQLFPMVFVVVFVAVRRSERGSSSLGALETGHSPLP